MWEGYLERDTMRPFLRWLDEKGIPMEKVHTSGHAGVGDLQRLRRAFGAAALVPVHFDGKQGARHEELFHNVQRRLDGERWDL
jgi:ribonuclease J